MPFLFQVLYIDYGNRATVPKSKLGNLPTSFHTPAGKLDPTESSISAMTGVLTNQNTVLPSYDLTVN